MTYIVVFVADVVGCYLKSIASFNLAGRSLVVFPSHFTTPMLDLGWVADLALTNSTWRKFY